MGINLRKFVPPYVDGIPHPDLSIFKKAAGVYIIANQQGDVVYVGFSGYNVHKTMFRHFQSWVDHRQKRATYPREGYLVRILSACEKRAYLYEILLIRGLDPKDNDLKFKDYQARVEEVRVMERSISEDPELGEYVPDLPF